MQFPSTSTYLHWKNHHLYASIVKFLDTFSVFHAKAMGHAPTYQAMQENHPFNTRRNARNAWGSDVGEAASAGTSRVLTWVSDESDDIWHLTRL